MYYSYMPSEVVLSYKGVNIYGVYKNDDCNQGLRKYWFGTEAEVSDILPEEEPCGAFDIRTSRTKSIPMGSHALETKYVYDHNLTVTDNLKRLIDLGGIDFNDAHPVNRPEPAKKPEGKKPACGFKKVCDACALEGWKAKRDCGTCFVRTFEKLLGTGEPSDAAGEGIRIGDEVQSAPGIKIKAKPFVVTETDEENHYFFGFNSDNFRHVQGGLGCVRTGKTLEDVLADAKHAEDARKKTKQSAGESIFLVTCESTGKRFLTEAENKREAAINADFATDLLNTHNGMDTSLSSYTVKRAYLEDIMEIMSKREFKRICRGTFLVSPED